jgi:hypothetical protein
MMHSNNFSKEAHFRGLGLRDLVSRLCGSFGEIRNQADLYAE